jgi:hypothetical protein
MGFFASKGPCHRKPLPGDWQVFLTRFADKKGWDRYNCMAGRAGGRRDEWVSERDNNKRKEIA